jgi:hypothetical protein
MLIQIHPQKTKNNMSIFHHKTMSFPAIDPLGDGLGDEIAAEQRESDAINSLDDVSAEELNKTWSVIVEDIKHDPEWFHFTED